MKTNRVKIIRPGMFGMQAAADARRGEFDVGNEILLHREIPVDAVFIGDSITHNWDVQAYFGRGGKFVVNRGISGDISGHVLRRFDADVLQLQPKIVVIKVGINNYWALDGWTESERKAPEAIIEEITNDIRQMAKKAANQGIRAVIGSILPTNMPFSGSDKIRNKAVLRTNAMLKEIAAEEGVIYADYYARLADKETCCLKDGFADDGLHPHVLGYNVMAEVLLEVFERSGIPW